MNYPQHINRLPKSHVDERFRLYTTKFTKKFNQRFVWISNYGNVFETYDYKDTVKRIKTYVTATNNGRKGYYAFSGKTMPHKYLHQAVAHLFIPNPHGLKEINHKNKDTHDNSIGNIEWCDHSANMRHAFGHENYHHNYTLVA